MLLTDLISSKYGLLKNHIVIARVTAVSALGDASSAGGGSASIKIAPTGLSFPMTYLVKASLSVAV